MRFFISIAARIQARKGINPAVAGLQFSNVKIKQLLLAFAQPLQHRRALGPRHALPRGNLIHAPITARTQACRTINDADPGAG